MYSNSSVPDTLNGICPVLDRYRDMTGTRPALENDRERDRDFERDFYRDF